MAKKDEEKVDNDAGAAVETADGPLLDLNDAAVKRMIKLAKKRGFVTYAELNAVLPSEEVSSDQIEDVYAMLSEMGITVSEGDDPDDVEGEEQAAEEEESEGGEIVEGARSTAVATRTSEPADRTDDPVRMYLREMGSVELLSRGDDRRPVRKPAHLPGHYHLARGAGSRQGSAARHHRS